MATINFNDAIFARRALTAFTARLSSLRIFATDFSGLAAQKGNAIYVPRVDALTATTFAYTNNSSRPYEGDGGSVNTITVNLNNHHIVPVQITDIDAVNSSAATGDKLAATAGRDLGKRVLQTIWSLITTGTFGSAAVTTSSANWSKTAIRQFRLALANDNVGLDNGFNVVCNETAFDGLLGDSNLSQAYLYGGPEVIRNARIPGVFGAEIYGSNLVPANGVSLTGFACVPDAIAVAMRYLAPQESGAYAAAFQVTDPESGFTMGYRRHFQPGTGKLHINLECLFGYAAGLTLGLKIATTATT